MAWTVPEMKEEKKETIIRNLQFIYCSIMPALGTQKLGQHVVHEGKENWTMVRMNYERQWRHRGTSNNEEITEEKKQ